MQCFLFADVVNSEVLLLLDSLCVFHTFAAEIVVLNFRFEPHFATNYSILTLITLHLP